MDMEIEMLRRELLRDKTIKEKLFVVLINEFYSGGQSPSEKDMEEKAYNLLDLLIDSELMLILNEENDLEEYIIEN